MPNAQQPEMRRGGHTRLVQDSDGPPPVGSRPPREMFRSLPPDQVLPYGSGGADTTTAEPSGGPAEGD
jgi:hypothetical protein